MDDKKSKKWPIRISLVADNISGGDVVRAHWSATQARMERAGELEP